MQLTDTLSIHYLYVYCTPFVILYIVFIVFTCDIGASGGCGSHATDQWRDDPVMWGGSQPSGVERLTEAGPDPRGDPHSCAPLQ